MINSSQPHALFEAFVEGAYGLKPMPSVDGKVITDTEFLAAEQAIENGEFTRECEKRKEAKRQFKQFQKTKFARRLLKLDL